MPAKLSEKEKALRGTWQRCRTRGARPLRTIRRELRELRKVIADMTFNVNLARKSIRKDGVMVETTVTGSDGRMEKTRRINPAFKIQANALTALKSLNRQMDFLLEERDAAEAGQHKLAEAEEFRI